MKRLRPGTERLAIARHEIRVPWQGAGSPATEQANEAEQNHESAAALHDLVELELGSRHVAFLTFVVGRLEQLGLQAGILQPRARMKLEVLDVGLGAHGTRDPIADAEGDEQYTGDEEHVLVGRETPRGPHVRRNSRASARQLPPPATYGNGFYLN